MDISTQRRSVFPSLLRSNAQHEAGRCIHVHDQNQKTPGKETERIKQPAAANHPGRTVTGCVTRQRTARSPKKIAPMNQRDEELQKKKHEKAEAVVRKWDTLLIKDKEDKHTKLLQRLELQRKLIAKNDLLSKQFEREAKEKHAKELQFHQDSQKKMMQDLRAHNKRVNEHKRMVAEKLRDSLISRPISHACPDPSPQLYLRRDVDAEETMPEEDTPHQSNGRCCSSRVDHSRLHQLLNFDPVREATPTIPNAWNRLKHDNERRMLPFVEYALYTRKFANPTSRQLLRYYDQPVKIDSKSGEKVPLLEILEREAQTQQTKVHAGTLTNALELKARRNQVRAEVLLCRKQAQVDIPVQQPTVYLPKDEYEDNTTQLHPQFLELKAVSVKPLPIDNQSKKKLPKYLAPDGTLLSGSLEEVGERVYCRPTKGKPAQTAKSMFPIDHELETDGQTHTPKCRPRWQPLSSSAMQEYEGTRVVPVKAFSSHQGHGQCSMWKPLSSHTIPTQMCEIHS